MQTESQRRYRTFLIVLVYLIVLIYSIGLSSSFEVNQRDFLYSVVMAFVLTQICIIDGKISGNPGYLRQEVREAFTSKYLLAGFNTLSGCCSCADYQGTRHKRSRYSYRSFTRFNICFGRDIADCELFSIRHFFPARSLYYWTRLNCTRSSSTFGSA